MRDLLIIDNSPTAYLFQPENALPISSWYEEKADRCLFDYIPFLKELSKVNDVRTLLRSVNEVEASIRNADPSDDGAGGDSNQHLVFLEHGIEAQRICIIQNGRIIDGIYGVKLLLKMSGNF